MNDDLKWLAENEHEWVDGASCAYIEDGKTRWVFGAYFWPHKIVVTQPQWQAARDELSGKPGWELAPNGYYWMAQDKDGKWFFYKTQPSPNDGAFYSRGAIISAPGTHRVLGDWRNTLERRPESVAVVTNSARDGNTVAYDFTAEDHAIMGAIGFPVVKPLRQFALTQIRAATEFTIINDDVREVFINLVTELDDETLAAVAGRVAK